MTPPFQPARRIKVGFSLTGEPHKWLHTLPLAADLSRRSDVCVILFAPDIASFRPAYRLFTRLGGASEAQWITLVLPELLEQITDFPISGASLKSVRLLRWSRCLKACDVLVTAEQNGLVGEHLSAPPDWTDRRSRKPTEQAVAPR